MTSRLRLFHQRNRFWAGVLLALLLTTAPAAALGIPQSQLTFKNVDIQIVIEGVARLTGTTFLFDPARVQGKITLLAAGESTPVQRWNSCDRPSPYTATFLSPDQRACGSCLDGSPLAQGSLCG
jgi:hypothetical protein